MPNRGGFSWKRATGISAAKSRVSRKTGIPLTKSGRQRKVGRMVTGGGCLLPALVLLGVAIAACSGGPAGELATLAPFVPAITDEPEPEDTPAPTAVPLKVTKVDGAGTVRPGDKATVTIDTVKGAMCSIVVEYASGESEAAGLGDKTADSDGRVKWSWTVGMNTGSGKVPIWITCSKGDREGDLDLTLTVTG